MATTNSQLFSASSAEPSSSFSHHGVSAADLQQQQNNSNMFQFPSPNASPLDVCYGQFQPQGATVAMTPHTIQLSPHVQAQPISAAYTGMSASSSASSSPQLHATSMAYSPGIGMSNGHNNYQQQQHQQQQQGGVGGGVMFAGPNTWKHKYAPAMRDLNRERIRQAMLHVVIQPDQIAKIPFVVTEWESKLFSEAPSEEAYTRRIQTKIHALTTKRTTLATAAQQLSPHMTSSPPLHHNGLSIITSLPSPTGSTPSSTPTNPILLSPGSSMAQAFRTLNMSPTVTPTDVHGHPLNRQMNRVVGSQPMTSSHRVIRPLPNSVLPVRLRSAGVHPRMNQKNNNNNNPNNPRRDPNLRVPPSPPTGSVMTQLSPQMNYVMNQAMSQTMSQAMSQGMSISDAMSHALHHHQQQSPIQQSVQMQHQFSPQLGHHHSIQLQQQQQQQQVMHSPLYSPMVPTSSPSPSPVTTPSQNIQMDQSTNDASVLDFIESIFGDPPKQSNNVNHVNMNNLNDVNGNVNAHMNGHYSMDPHTPGYQVDSASDLSQGLHSSLTRDQIQCQIQSLHSHNQHLIQQMNQQMNQHQIQMSPHGMVPSSLPPSPYGHGQLSRHNSIQNSVPQRTSPLLSRHNSLHLSPTGSVDADGNITTVLKRGGSMDLDEPESKRACFDNLTQSSSNEDSVTCAHPGCGERRLEYPALRIFCGSCNQLVRTRAYYYEGPFCICQKCYTMADNQVIDAHNNTLVDKSSFDSNRKQNLPDEEPWVQCDGCTRWFHCICTMFNLETDHEQSQFFCSDCNPRMYSSPYQAKAIPETPLSSKIETRVNQSLIQAGVENHKHIYIRVLSCVEKRVPVSESLRKRQWSSGRPYPNEFPYKSKAIFGFQERDGSDVMFFGMYVHEYGSDCPYPNSGRVYISYLDSVPDAVQPESSRTFIYHNILLSYLDDCKKRGFENAHIWVCPPEKGDDYVFYRQSKTPIPAEALRKWYIKMLEEALKEQIVLGYRDMLDEYRDLKSVSELPYLDGDHFKTALDTISEDPKGESVAANGGDSNHDPNQLKVESSPSHHQSVISIHSPPLPSESTEHLSSYPSYLNNETDINGCQTALGDMNGLMMPSGMNRLTSDCLVSRISEEMKTLKKYFIVVKLLETDCNRQTIDDHPKIVCEMVDDRQSFLMRQRISLEKKKPYLFDSIRRAKHSTMMILYHILVADSGVESSFKTVVQNNPTFNSSMNLLEQHGQLSGHEQVDMTSDRFMGDLSQSLLRRAFSLPRFDPTRKIRHDAADEAIQGSMEMRSFGNWLDYRLRTPDHEGSWDLLPRFEEFVQRNVMSSMRPEWRVKFVHLHQRYKAVIANGFPPRDAIPLMRMFLRLVKGVVDQL